MYRIPLAHLAVCAYNIPNYNGSDQSIREIFENKVEIEQVLISSVFPVSIIRFKSHKDVSTVLEYKERDTSMQLVVVDVEPTLTLRLEGWNKLSEDRLHRDIAVWTGGIPIQSIDIPKNAQGNVKGHIYVKYVDLAASFLAYYLLSHHKACSYEVRFARECDTDPIGSVKRLELTCRDALIELGEDPMREGLLKTPHRWAKALTFLTKGYDESLHDIINGAVFTETTNKDLVLVKNVAIYSLCEHHMLPFFGRAHIAYIPNGKLLGLSKVARIAEMYSRRLQLQERLTKQIAQAIQDVLQPLGVAVVTECMHLCMSMRGVSQQDATTVTSALLGAFQLDHGTRSELFQLINSTSSKL